MILKIIYKIMKTNTKPNPKFKCGMSVSLLKCQYDKKGICTLDVGNSIKCANRGNIK